MYQAKTLFSPFLLCKPNKIAIFGEQNINFTDEENILLDGGNGFCALRYSTAKGRRHLPADAAGDCQCPATRHCFKGFGQCNRYEQY